jgi:hypothetical protein
MTTGARLCNCILGGEPITNGVKTDYGFWRVPLKSGPRQGYDQIAVFPGIGVKVDVMHQTGAILLYRIYEDLVKNHNVDGEQLHKVFRENALDEFVKEKNTPNPCDAYIKFKQLGYDIGRTCT